MSILTQVIVNGLILGGLYALMTQGLAIIFGVMRVINLAHGELFLLGAYLAWVLNDSFGLSPFLATPALAAAGLVLGWVICRVLILPVVERPPLMALLITFGLAAIAASSMRLYFSTAPRVIRTEQSSVIYTVLGQRLPANRLLMLAFALAFLGAIAAYMRYTRFGKAMRAAAQDKEAAKVIGINIPVVYCGAFAIGTALVFVAGGLFGATQGFHPFMGPIFTLKSFAIIVFGGIGRISGTFTAAIFLGMVETFFASYVPGHGTGLGVAVAFVLVVVVLAVRPEGLFKIRAAKIGV